MRRLFAWLLPLGLLSCTGGPPSAESLTTQDTIAACRAQANTTYAVQNRDQIYSMSDLDAPQSSIGLTKDPNQALVDRYTQERMIQDCIRNTGTETSRTGLSPAGEPGGAAGAAKPSGTPSGTLSP